MPPHMTNSQLDGDTDDDVPTVARPQSYVDAADQVIADYRVELATAGHNAATINNVIGALQQAVPILASFAPGVGPLVVPAVTKLLALIPPAIA